MTYARDAGGVNELEYHQTVCYSPGRADRYSPDAMSSMHTSVPFALRTSLSKSSSSIIDTMNVVRLASSRAVGDKNLHQ